MTSWPLLPPSLTRPLAVLAPVIGLLLVMRPPFSSSSSSSSSIGEMGESRSSIGSSSASSHGAPQQLPVTAKGMDWGGKAAGPASQSSDLAPHSPPPPPQQQQGQPWRAQAMAHVKAQLQAGAQALGPFHAVMNLQE